MVVVFRRYAEVDVDFRTAVLADSFRRKAGVKLIGRDSDLAFSYELHELFHRHFFFFRNDFHLRRNDAFAGCVHLSCVSHKTYLLLMSLT